jgi:transposase
VAVPPERAAPPGQRCGAFPADLYALAAWRRQGQSATGVRESTGVDWRTRFAGLDERGFAVKLVEPHAVRPVPGRQTDAQECPWLPELPTAG